MSTKRQIFKDIQFKLLETIEEKKNLIEVIEEHGGTVISDDKLVQSSQLLYLVLSDFQGSTFESLRENKEHYILAPRCIYDCIVELKPPPKVDHPLYSLLFQGTHIAYDGMTQEIADLIEYMYGVLQEDVDMSTSYLLATDVLQPQYLKAVKHGIPIIQPVWINQCWRTQTLLPAEQFVLPPFSGCTISVTGLRTGSRIVIEQLAINNGGTYSADLTKKCTHLIAERPVGQKYQYARLWGIYVIKPAWFFESVQAGVCLNPENYSLLHSWEDMEEALAEEEQNEMEMNNVYDQVLGAFQSVNDVIDKILRVDTVCELLEQCSNRENAKKACISFIVWHIDEVAKTEGWSRLQQNLKEEVRKQLDFPMVTENVLQ